MNITQKRLKELLRYNPSTGIFTQLVSRGGTAIAGSVAGSKNTQGYLQIQIDGTIYLSHRLAWLYVHGYFPEHQIDHIDRSRDNNRISNLREVTRTCNLRNTGNYRHNTSGVKGVCWVEERGKWKAQIMIDRKTIYLGNHNTKIEAVCHRLAAEQAENWHGCDSSSPAYKFVMDGLET